MHYANSRPFFFLLRRYELAKLADNTTKIKWLLGDTAAFLYYLKVKLLYFLITEIFLGLVGMVQNSVDNGTAPLPFT